MARRASLGRLFTANLGLVFWAAQFTIVYMITSGICTRDHTPAAAILSPGFVPPAIIATTLAALAATALVLIAGLRTWRAGGEADATGRFFDHLTVTVSAISLLAIVWTGLPALLVPACG